MDEALRAAQRAYALNKNPQTEALLEKEARRAGWVEHYVPCKRCQGGSRTVRSHGRAVLCDVCCGDGWTHTEWGPSESD